MVRRLTPSLSWWPSRGTEHTLGFVCAAGEVSSLQAADTWQRSPLVLLTPETALGADTCSATENNLESPVLTFLCVGRSWKGSLTLGWVHLHFQRAWCGPSQVLAMALARE